MDSVAQENKECFKWDCDLDDLDNIDALYNFLNHTIYIFYAHIGNCYQIINVQDNCLETFHYEDLIYKSSNNSLSFVHNNKEIDSSDNKEYVNHPKHYGGDTEYECIKVLKHWLNNDEYIGFLKGNVIKYLCRHGKKDDSLQEIKKAKWYLDKLVECMGENKNE